MKILNKLPLIIGIFLIWLYFQGNDNNQPITQNDNNNQVAYQVSKEVYYIKKGSVYDGDTVRVISSNNEELKIRFACVDAPEKKMEYGIQSRDYLRSLLNSNGNKVNLDITNTDRYGRKIAVLYLLNGEAVQTLQVKNGWVYSYAQYKDDCPIWNDIEKAEAIAISKGINLYSKNLEKPWEYRRKKIMFFEILLPIYITQQFTCYITDINNKTLDLSESVCGIKAPSKTCDDYATPEEAQQAFEAKLPGTQYLDRDGDGSVCEWGTASDSKSIDK